MKTQKATFARLLFVVLPIFGVAAACQSNEVPSTAGGSAKVSHSSADKPAAAINISHEVMGIPRFGEPVLVRITATPGKGATELRLQLTPDAGLSIASTDSSFSHRYGAESTPVTFEIEITPLAEGLHYLTILATMDIDSRSQSSTGAVALQVGPVQQPLLKPESNEENREAVISMPAVETQD